MYFNFWIITNLLNFLLHYVTCSYCMYFDIFVCTYAYCTLRGRIKDKNSMLSAIKCEVCCIKHSMVVNITVATVTLISVQ